MLEAIPDTDFRGLPRLARERAKESALMLARERFLREYGLSLIGFLKLENLFYRIRIRAKLAFTAPSESLRVVLDRSLEAELETLPSKVNKLPDSCFRSPVESSRETVRAYVAKEIRKIREAYKNPALRQILKAGLSDGRRRAKGKCVDEKPSPGDVRVKECFQFPGWDTDAWRQNLTETGKIGKAALSPKTPIVLTGEK